MDRIPDIDRETQDAWQLGETIPGVNFRMCQSVSVCNGPDSGKVGEVICILRLAPEPLYLVEVADGPDLYAYQSEIVSIRT